MGERYEKVNETLARHVWLQFALSIALVFGAVLLINPGESAPGLLVRLISSSAGGIAIVMARRRREKRAAGGSTDELISLDRKLRHGDVPTDPQEKDAMRALLAERLHRTRHRRLGIVVLVVMGVGIVTALAFTSPVLTTIGYAVFLTLTLGWALMAGTVAYHRMLRMRDELGGGGTATSA